MTRNHQEQLGLSFDGSGFADSLWQKLLEATREVVNDVGTKTAVYELDVSPSQFSHALAERGNFVVNAEWVVKLAALDKHRRIAKVFADVAGCDLVERAPVEPEDELAALHEVLGESLSVDIRAGLMAKARQRAAAKKARKR